MSFELDFSSLRRFKERKTLYGLYVFIRVYNHLRNRHVTSLNDYSFTKDFIVTPRLRQRLSISQPTNTWVNSDYT